MTSRGPALEDTPAPTPSDGWALVRTVKIGVSPLDASLMESRIEASFTLGHEFVGVVEGGEFDQRSGIATGVRVVGSPDIVCGACDLCRSGLSAHCRERKLLGSPGCDGCMGELFAIPSANLCEIPQGVGDDEAVLALALARAVHASSMVHIEGRPYVTVLGRGAEAILAAQVMTRRNASVRIISNCGATLSAAERIGIRHRPQVETGQRADQDVVVDVSPPGGGLNVAASMVRPRGSLVLLRPLATPGSPGEDGADLTPIVEREIGVIGCRASRLREAVMMLQRGEVNVEGLITHRAKLDHATEAIDEARRPDQLKVVIDV